jgi:hypothetical protein
MSSLKNRPLFWFRSLLMSPAAARTRAAAWRGDTP